LIILAGEAHFISLGGKIIIMPLVGAIIGIVSDLTSILVSFKLIYLMFLWIMPDCALLTVFYCGKITVIITLTAILPQ
jgi:hypothetical protein